MFRNNRYNRRINNRRIQNPQLQRHFNQFNNQNNFNQQNPNMEMNNFNNKEALQQSGIQVLPFDESNKEEVIDNSKNNIQGDIIFATDEFKEKMLNQEKVNEVNKHYKEESIKKVKFEISEIYKNELNRKNFYTSLLKNCGDSTNKNNINIILQNCNKVFSIYEKERFFKGQPNYIPKEINVNYNKSIILYAIEEENKIISSLINEYQNSWDQSKLNRILIIKLHDLAILNSILARI